MRYSRQRECILDYVKSVKCHPTAETVHYNVKKVIPKISLGTVYRNLGKLCESGDIIKIESELAEINYDGATHSHQHFVCRGCGELYDLELNSHINECERLGFKVEKENTVFYGYCNNCKK